MPSATPHGGASTATSSASASSASASAAIEYYFCHRCCLAAPLAADDVCPLCGCACLEEIDDPPSRSPNPYPSPFLTIGSVSHSPASFALRSPADVAALFHSDISPLSPLISNSILVEALIEHLISLGTSAHAVVLGVPPPAPGALSVPSTLDDLGEFANQIFDNELALDRYLFDMATSESAIAALPSIEITEATASSEAQCAVCLETFAVGAEATQLPCNHVFHRDCITPWLDLHNTCPECRFKLPTEDEGGPGTTVVFMIVIVPLSWDDPPHRTVIVQRRVPRRLILRPIRGAQCESGPTETRREELQPH